MEEKKFLLIGNSRLHWAQKINNTFIFSHSSIKQSNLQSEDFDNLIWASVGNLPYKKLKRENEINTKDLCLKNIPNYFGVDRGLAAYAALRQTNIPNDKNILIADLGTTLSITKISSTGIIIGGQLIPGFYTQLNSMAQSAHNLSLPRDIKIPDEDFPLDTQQAMFKGVQNALLGSILQVFNDHSDFLILCGGDSELLGSFVKLDESKFLIEPNLVMLGMIYFFVDKK